MRTTRTDARTKRIAVDDRCVACFQGNYEGLISKYKFDERQQATFLDFFGEIMGKKDSLTSPEIQRELNVKFCNTKGIEDPYAKEKEESNWTALEIYRQWKPMVVDSSTPFDLALRLAIAGNIMDYGACANFNVHETIEKVLSSPFAIDHTLSLRKRIQNSKKILYLGDNAGEIVLDRLLIETIMHHDLTYVVKGGPVLNDVTLEDARQSGMEYVADVITNGFDAPSTILTKCSPAFLKHYHEADLIISKGQGNLEGLLHTGDPRVFFLLMVKCDVIAETLKVKKGDFVVFNQN